MNRSMYLYKGQYITMTQNETAAVFNALEKSLRTTSFNYVEDRAFPNQVAEIKSSWPEGDVRTFFKNKALELAGKGNAISMAVVRKALIATSQKLAELRSQASQRSLESEHVYAASEMAMATVFHRAPDPTVNPKAIPSVRDYANKSKMIRVKPSMTTTQLYVNLAEMDSAEFFVLALYCEALKVSYLLGFATKAQVKVASCEKEATYKQIPLERLCPMSALYTELGLNELPAGIAFETIADSKLIPITASKELQSMIPKDGQQPDNYDIVAEIEKYEKAHGRAMPASASPAPASVAQPQQPPSQPSQPAQQSAAQAKVDIGDL